MTAEAGDIILLDRMIGDTGEFMHNTGVAFGAEFSPVIEQQRRVVGMDFMAVGAGELLGSVGVKAIIVQFDMGDVTFEANLG